MRLSEGEVVRVAGRSGIVWATMEGDLKDYVIPAGKHAQFAAAGLLVIQGIDSENEASLEAEGGALCEVAE
jgi:ribosomal protein L35AE/L33A